MLSEVTWKSEMRNRRIALAVMAAIVIVGLPLFRNASDDAQSAVGLVGFFTALVLAHTLDAIDRWRARRDGSGSD